MVHQGQFFFMMGSQDHVHPSSQPRLKRLRDPIWTHNKALIIQRYLYYFVLITKHGTYIDGFAGPQEPSKERMWTAKLVKEVEPKWLRHFHLCDCDPKQAHALRALHQTHHDPPQRTVDIYEGDFNEHAPAMLSNVSDQEATFCLLDQRTFECDWRTVELVAHHKPRGRKIELFYFLPSGWLNRAVSGLKQRDSRLQRWWGRGDCLQFVNRKPQDRANFFADRLRQNLGYKYATPWPIYERADGGTVMYFMVHASDHSEAPLLMRRAYERAVLPAETHEQLNLEFAKKRSQRQADRANTGIEKSA